MLSRKKTAGIHSLAVYILDLSISGSFSKKWRFSTISFPGTLFRFLICGQRERSFATGRIPESNKADLETRLWFSSHFRQGTCIRLYIFYNYDYPLGMLLAGELYIHFKDKSVQKLKFEEMLKSLSQHISKNIDSTVDEDEKHSNLPPGMYFIRKWLKVVYVIENSTPWFFLISKRRINGEVIS